METPAKSTDLEYGVGAPRAVDPGLDSPGITQGMTLWTSRYGLWLCQGSSSILLVGASTMQYYVVFSFASLFHGESLTKSQGLSSLSHQHLHLCDDTCCTSNPPEVLRNWLVLRTSPRLLLLRRSRSFWRMLPSLMSGCARCFPSVDRLHFWQSSFPKSGRFLVHNVHQGVLRSD